MPFSPSSLCFPISWPGPSAPLLISLLYPALTLPQPSFQNILLPDLPSVLKPLDDGLRLPPSPFLHLTRGTSPSYIDWDRNKDVVSNLGWTSEIPTPSSSTALARHFAHFHSNKPKPSSLFYLSHIFHLTRTLTYPKPFFPLAQGNVLPTVP